MSFFVQPSILERSPSSSLEAFQAWLSGQYRIGAGLVFFVSLAVAIAWYFVAYNAQLKKTKDVSFLSVFWWAFLLLPIISVGVSLHFFSGRAEWQILPPLACFHILNILIVYWLSTALSTPKLLKYVVPGAFFIRRLLRF